MSTAVELPYTAMASVYDKWMAADKIPYDQWRAFTVDRFASASGTVHKVVDICCGTGMTIRTLQDEGYAVAGVDASAHMLDIARGRVDPGTSLTQLVLPAERFTSLGTFDAALMCFDGVNYFTGTDALPAVLGQVAQVLRPGGVLVFDLSTRVNFEAIAEAGEFGEDLGDFAYIWNTRHVAGSPHYEYVVSLFLPQGGLFRRVVERHAQRWFARSEVAAALHDAGFEAVAVTENYSDRPVSDSTRRDTWSARLARSGGL